TSPYCWKRRCATTSCSCAARTLQPSSSRDRSWRWRTTNKVQLVLVSGLSGSGKSIALDVLEDSGYYCVDNLPATLLLDVVKFLDEAGHGRVAVSVDARSIALASLPGRLTALKERGVQTQVLFLEASAA